MNDSTTISKGVPRWATDPFRQFIDHSERLRQLLHLSTTGIAVLRGMPRIVEVLQKIEPGESTSGPERLERAKKEAELAQREVDEGFPLLKAQALISLWSGLEATIRTFFARWLQNKKDALLVEPLQKLRVKIGEYEKLQGEEKFFYILDRLEQEMSVPLKNGVGRFEALFEVFGISGSVNAKDRQDLFELNNIRNVLVHRSGMADRRIIEACPALGLKLGEPIGITNGMVIRYFNSAIQYTTDIIVRLGELHGVDMTEFKERLRE